MGGFVEDEKKIQPPINPLTVKLNLAVLDFYWRAFVQKWVPAFDAVITSAYRDPKKNQSVGGVGNSAHLHGLAYDWVLRDPLSGRYLSKSQAKKIFDDFVLPNWSGYALFEEGGDVPGWHYHTNLSREVTLYAGLVAATGLGVVGYKLVENWIEGKKGGSGHE